MVVAPGYGGRPDGPLVSAVVNRLASAGLTARAVAYGRGRPVESFGPELDEVRQVRDRLVAEGVARVAFVGRSFGGRLCARVAAAEPPLALALLGYPIAPPGRARPIDEAAFAAVRCPILIVQGERDPLGPLDVIRGLAAGRPDVDVHVLAGVGHSFGRRQAEALDVLTGWLTRFIAAPL